MQQTLTGSFFFSFIFCSPDHSSETAPYTSSEPVDSRPSTQEGKQTSQESASTSKRLRYNLAPVKNFDCHRLVEGPKLDTKSSSVTVLPIGLALDSAGLFLKTHYHCISITVCSVMTRLTLSGSRFLWHQPCQRCKYTTSVDIQKRTMKSYSLM